MNRKALLVPALLLAPATSPALAQDAALALPTCDYGEANPAAPEEVAQFAFLIGDFTIAAHAWQGHDWSPARPGAPARWNGRWVLGGMAIEDEWYSRDPGMEPDTGRGINVRMWDAEAGEWDMMWFDTASRQVQDLRAAMIDGVLTMWQVYPEREDFRATFHVTGPDTWHRISYVPDGEGGWTPQYKLAATRIGCE